MPLIYWILIVALLVLVIVALVFSSIDRPHWTAAYADLKHHSREPMRDLRYDVADTMSGGALSLCELFGADTANLAHLF